MFIEEGNPSFDDNFAVNWEKLEMVSREISHILKAQTAVLNFQRNIALKAYILYDLNMIPNEEQYNLSLEIQPRGMKFQ